MPYEYRYEIKYLIAEQYCDALKVKLPHLLSIDSHAGSNGEYCIRSLYYDDLFDSGYYENINGVDPRAKYRLRFYVGNTDFIKLELKEKRRTMTKKTSCTISQEQVKNLIEYGSLEYSENLPYLAKRFYCDIQRRHLLPKIIVEYDRTPYIYNIGNVRITLDQNIRSSTAVKNFLTDDLPMRPVMPSGMHILEVKYDGFLPDHIRAVVFQDNLIHTDYSKYCMCRCFQIKNESRL